MTDGSSGNIYSSQGASAKPNTATLTVPTQYTASGVGSAIPVSQLGEWTTYTTTIPGTTVPPSTIPAHALPASTASGGTVEPATTEPASTIAGTTIAPQTSTVTTHVAKATAGSQSIAAFNDLFVISRTSLLALSAVLLILCL